MLKAGLVGVAVGVAEVEQIATGNGAHLPAGHPAQRRDLTVGDVQRAVVAPRQAGGLGEGGGDKVPVDAGLAAAAGVDRGDAVPATVRTCPLSRSTARTAWLPVSAT
jgi:hypothetical protein